MLITLFQQKTKGSGLAINLRFLHKDSKNWSNYSKKQQGPVVQTLALWNSFYEKKASLYSIPKGVSGFQKRKEKKEKV